MKKLWLRTVLSGLVVMTFVLSGSPAQKVSAFAGGTGTSADPYQISTCLELLKIDDSVANLSAHYVLSGNIDCTGETVVPMVNGTTYFSGTLDGNNFELIGLSITCSTGFYCALFPRVTGNAVIRNLIVKAPVIDSSAGGAMWTAVLIGDDGDNDSQAMTISNVTVTGGSITARTLNAGSAYTGSLVGRSKNGSILNSHSSATVIGAGRVGGLVGTMGNSSSGVCNSLGPNIDSSSFSGSVSGARELGGLVGYFGSNSGLNDCEISNSFNTGNVSSATGCVHIGGIVGVLYESTVVSAYNTGVIGGSSCSDAGGIVGKANGRSSGVFTNSAVVRSHSSGAVSGTGNVGGVVGVCEFSSVSQSYSSGSVTATVSFGGGLVGNSYCSIQDSYSVSDVVGAGNKGGLVGQNGSTGVITRSYSNASGRPFAHTNGGTCTTANNATNYWDTSTGAATSVCATGKTSLLMKTASTFIDAGWNFTQGSAVWSIDPNINNGYPFHSSAGVDITAPTASWTEPSTPSSSRTLSYTLTFSESVTAIATGDFEFLGTATGCSATPAASTANVSVVVTVTCTSDGTVRVRLKSGSVLDASSNTGPPTDLESTSVTISVPVVTTTTTTDAPSNTVAPSNTQAPSNTAAPSNTQAPSNNQAPLAPQSQIAAAPATTTTVAQRAQVGVVAAQVTTTTVAPTSSSSTTTTLPPVNVPTVSDDGGALVIDGQRVEATITRENNQLILKAGSVTARISAIKREGGRAPLDSSGRVRVAVGDSVEIEVTGFESSSTVEVRMYSDPVLLGRTAVGGNGTLLASYEISDSVDNGRHTIVLLGNSASAEELTFALPVFVGDESTGPSVVAVLVAIPLGLAVIVGLVLPAVLRRRRKEEE